MTPDNELGAPNHRETRPFLLPRDRTPYWANPLNGHFNCAGHYVMPPKPADMWPEDPGRANWGHKWRMPGGGSWPWMNALPVHRG